jgi:proteasome accessory factor C
MSNARDQVQRLLALVPYLRENDGARVDDVAKEFGVRPKQIIADLKVLWFCGLPGAQMGDLIEIDIEAAEGDGVIHINNADYLARPLRLAAAEALALLTALRTLREVTAGAAGTPSTARSRNSSGRPVRPRRRVRVQPRMFTSSRRRRRSPRP